MEEEQVIQMKEKICGNCKHQEVCVIIERVEDATHFGWQKHAFYANDIAKICHYYEEGGEVG